MFIENYQSADVGHLMECFVAGTSRYRGVQVAIWTLLVSNDGQLYRWPDGLLGLSYLPVSDGSGIL
jgi:hypothetical protein